VAANPFFGFEVLSLSVLFSDLEEDLIDPGLAEPGRPCHVGAAEAVTERERRETLIALAVGTSDVETSQSFVARLETTAADAKISTVDRYAESLGYVLQYHLIPTAQADSAPSVVVHAP
jgi:hypothetical protein